MVLTNSRLPLYREHLKKKFNTVENLYYSNIDDLIQTLGDLDLADIASPDLTLTEFTFITQWEDGLLSSGQVCQVFEHMNIEDAAKAKITKRLTNHMLRYDELSNHIKPVIAALSNECIDPMIDYLNMMKKFFSKMQEIDKSQLTIDWVQQIYKQDQLVTDKQEMTLNQTIKHIEAFVYQASEQKFHISDQVIIFDEDLGFDERVIHWIFGPRTYIELIKSIFEIKVDLQGHKEEDFLKQIMEEFIK